jgi:hypothetical protein
MQRLLEAPPAGGDLLGLRQAGAAGDARSERSAGVPRVPPAHVHPAGRAVCRVRREPQPDPEADLLGVPRATAHHVRDLRPAGRDPGCE